MAIVIFGGNGFVGAHLTRRLLEAGEHVIVCDLVNLGVDTRAAFVSCDVRNPDTFAAIPATARDVVINLAANQYHHKVPRKGRREFFFDTNTKGVRNILEWMSAAGINKMIQFTTDMIYGKPQYLPLDVNHPQEPLGFYGQSKKAAEEICREFRQQGIDITIFRPRMINGPGRLGILKKLFFLIQRGLPVPMIGSGKNCYQMISVYDCVSAVTAAIKHGCPNREYNLGSKNPPSIRELLTNLIDKAGSRSFVLPTSGPLVKTALGVLGAAGIELMYKEQYMIADEDYILDITGTEKDLGWTPEFSDYDMLVAAYNDFVSHGGER
jgi:dTDP-glucose 4,6-dehydratase